MRILLTGASGFVGQHTLAALSAHSDDIHAVSRRPAIAPNGCRWHEADLLSPGLAKQLIGEIRPDCVLHLAWYVEHGKFWTDPVNLDWVGATLDLARASADAGIPRFISTGTCYEYDWPDTGDCDERTTPLSSHSLYDTSKDCLRRLLETFFSLNGTSFAWARLFFLYGPGEGPGRLVSSLARSLVAGEKAMCSKGLAVRDFMDVRDVAAALAALAASPVTGPVNIATGHEMSVADIALTMGRIAGREDLVRLGALPDRAGEPPRIVAKVDRLTREVGFTPMWSIEQGLEEALAYWRERAERGALA
jgi:nucleoside-diphosphate-sugar epimerase